MKKILTLLALLISPLMLLSQTNTKIPTVMVVPSDVWCNKSGYTTEFEAFGKKELIPDYDRALKENPEMLLAISKIGEMFSNRGLNLKDLSSELKYLETTATERAEMALEDGGIAESSLDKLRARAKADIWIYLTWIENRQGNKKSITLDLHAIDAYSNKQIAAASGSGYPNEASRPLAVMVEEAILMRIDAFNYQIQNYFTSLDAQGREITLECLTTNNSDINFDSVMGDDLLSFKIEDWMAANTVYTDGKVSGTKDMRGIFSLGDATATMMKFEQVRIPMRDEGGRPIDARYWARGLMRELMIKHNLDVAIGMRGLGNAYIIINGTRK
ncbi:MAG: DUF6175 family protein [Rikenellaceae bacterium]